MSKNKQALFPIATALIKHCKGYNLSTFKKDFLSAFVVSLVALPLSMALSIAVGLPPQHGLYTAIVAGVIVPLLGGSAFQVSGPTAAFVVILAPIVTQFGIRGIVWSSIMAGILLIAFGVSRLGRLINFIPYPVTTGFTAGIAVVLGTLSLNDFMGLNIAKLDGEFIDKLEKIFHHIPSFSPAELATGVVTLALLFYSGKITRYIPSAIIAIGAGSLIGLLFASSGYDISTIGSRFSYIDLSGNKISGIPPYPPMFHLPHFSGNDVFTIPNFEEFKILLMPAITIAILAALESLLSATVADSMAGTNHEPNSELVGIGIGNIASALALGIPATGAIARTSVNINNGGKTPLAASMHAIMIMVYMLLLAPVIKYVPMTCLSALLIHTAYRMSHYRQFIKIIKIAPKSDSFVLISCFLMTVFVDMVAGVSVGMIFAGLLLIRRISELTDFELQSHKNGKIPHKDLPEGTMIYKINGPLFFNTIEKAFDRSSYIQDFVNNFIVDISSVPFIDMSGLVALESMLSSIASEERNVRIISSNQAVIKRIKKNISSHALSKYVSFHDDIKSAISMSA